MNATFTQFLSPKFGLFAGKIFTLDNFKGEFTGDLRNQFMNTALTFPMAGDLHCDLGVRRGSRRPAVGGRHPLGHGARRRRHAHEQRHLQGVPERRRWSSPSAR